ncbi:Ig-like domain-containing protein [Microvirga sp. 2YAF29]|uniref:Ig-like domain-containing protein n=1 Tax=Microvirga sp. 2YAF29 TaxID=3233031 RepID=UPI003F960620
MDSVVPPAPSTPDLAASSDTGTSNSDNITGDTTPTFTGTAEVGATVRLYSGSTEIGSTVAVNGTWSITSSTLAAGSYLITARATDTAGNDGPVSQALQIEVVTAAPGTKVNSIAFSSDTGASATDFVTRTASQTISGTLDTPLQAGERVELSLDGGQSWTTAATDNYTSWSLAATLVSGTHTILVRVANAVDAGGEKYERQYTLDTVAPTLAITSDMARLKAGETATITLTFSEDPGSSFTWDGSVGDIMVSGGTLSAISGSGLIRTATFTPSPDTNGGMASITGPQAPTSMQPETAVELAQHLA